MFENWTREFYKESEYPVLLRQKKLMELSKPFKGLKILDNTPIFRNTLLKYECLIASGAELFIAVSPSLPHDEKIVGILEQVGIPLVQIEKSNASFDIVLDCAGFCRKFTPKIGTVELTRSGVENYENAPFPVFVADSGEIKKIETSFGTGDGYFRAMKKFGYSSFLGSEILVFGFGKVGSGIVHYALKYGAFVTVVADFSDGFPEKENENVQFIHLKNYPEISCAIKNADFIVSATGKKNALAVDELELALKETHAVLANMGVEDEYGAQVSDSRVLFNKKPLNFSLEEPTQMKFMDATMALHNALGKILLDSKELSLGINPLPFHLEEEILEITRKYGNVF
jgi:adenosylhomocysteinase